MTELRQIEVGIKNKRKHTFNVQNITNEQDRKIFQEAENEYKQLQQETHVIQKKIKETEYKNVLNGLSNLCTSSSKYLLGSSGSTSTYL